jgi:AraC-like DNA-binding protein/quercetin dioxygenase-like cupin family protein
VVDELTESVRFHESPVAGVEPMTASTARSFPRHTHDQYGIGIVDAGGHASWSDRGQVEAGPGTFICVNPGEVHDGRAIRESSRTWRLLYIEPSVMRDANADILDGAAEQIAFTAPVFADDPLRRRFDSAFAHATATAGRRDEMACETALLTFIARLHAYSTARRGRANEATAGIRRARNRIDDDPSAHVTLAELAREAGLSRYQLIRAFTRELGLTPHAYILQQRIALARRLIRAHRSLADVASAAGFCDQSHLTRCFLRQYGVTPGGYAHFHPRRQSRATRDSAPCRTFADAVRTTSRRS